ncbi:MAG TPA: DUF3300 domain-containing protein, partial [Dongiaceae bacterium]
MKAICTCSIVTVADCTKSLVASAGRATASAAKPPAARNACRREIIDDRPEPFVIATSPAQPSLAFRRMLSAMPRANTLRVAGFVGRPGGDGNWTMVQRGSVAGPIAPTSNRCGFLRSTTIRPNHVLCSYRRSKMRPGAIVTERLVRLASTLLFAALCSAGPMVPASRAQFADVQGDAATVAPDDDSEAQAAVPALSADDLRALVAPVALYPDELLAIVLPASTNPLQVVQAARFLEKQKADPNLKPDPNWDPAIIALLNYPQVIKQLNDDLDWTEQLGNAVMDQQEDVLNAIQAARADASSAGYLKSNDQQVVVNDNDNITIESTQPDVVYVPTYDPQTVVTNNYVNYPPPVYSEPYPAYYAPGATFFAGAIVGATFAYAFDWDDDDIDIDCCDGGDINNDINIDRGDVNIGSGNVNVDKTKIQERFNGDRTKAGSDGKMKWSSQ